MLSAELAIVVIGGMVSSTFLTLLVIPAIYSLVYRGRKQSVTR
jgi:HAE1 family hydrophobic/amphiphilic exporter-1